MSRPYSRTGLARLRRGRKPRPICLSSTEFEATFLRERSRANRSLAPFSVATFSFHGRSASDSAVESIVELTRCSDSVGRLDRRTVAVLLPCTSGQNAWTAVDRVQSELAKNGWSAEPDVYAHEFDDADEHAGVDERRSANGRQTTNGEHRRLIDDSAEEESGHTDRNGTGHQRPVAMARWRRSEPADRTARPVDEMSDIRSGGGARPVQDLWDASWKPLSPWRRATDIAVAGVGLIALAPLFALVALAVKLTTPGPAFFVQKRAGVGGKPFSFIKFRSMYIDAEERRKALEAKNEKDGPIFKIKNDPRLTPLGRLLRKSSIDELPQLYNVLVGDMTLIGPRPPTMNEVEDYEPWQRDRLSVPGGLTCIWQVSGRSDVGFEDWVRMDLRYALQRSPSLDLQVMSRTVKAVVTGRGAY